MAEHDILAGLDWKPVEEPDASSDIPHATHQGVLELYGHKLRCYRLSDGRAIIHADDVHAFFVGATPAQAGKGE